MNTLIIVLAIHPTSHGPVANIGRAGLGWRDTPFRIALPVQTDVTVGLGISIGITGPGNALGSIGIEGTASGTIAESVQPTGFGAFIGAVISWVQIVGHQRTGACAAAKVTVPA